MKNMEVCNNPEPKMVWVKEEPEVGKACDKFQAKVMHRYNNSVFGSEKKSRELAKEQSKVQDIIAKILDKNSPKTSNMDKKLLMKSLKSIPLVKRKDVIMQITKNLLMKYPGSNG
jgi:predicted HTH transcriptional regulator